MSETVMSTDFSGTPFGRGDTVTIMEETQLDRIERKLDDILAVIDELKPLADKYKEFSANPVKAMLSRGKK